jgi:penicillin-binding protein 1A
VGNYEALPGGLDRTIQTKRQPGSTFKPIVYSYALNTHQVTPATQFRVEPSKKERAELVERAKKATEGEETPPEVPEHLTLSLRQGIAKSDNRVARQVFRQAGGQQAVQWAQAMGITSHLGPDESLMLGSYEVTVTEMVGAFSVFASGGTAQEPLFLRSIESGAGPITLKERAPERRVMDPAVAYVTTSLLESVVQEGTGKRASVLGRPLAGKTGTTNQAKDAWFIGYSTEIVVAVWVGYDDAMPLGWGESGATSALPIWTAFMKQAHKGKPPTQFPRPAAVQDAQIDPATGLLARFGQEDAITEIFLPGTQPEETAPDPEEMENQDSASEEAESGDDQDAGEDAVPDEGAAPDESAAPDDGGSPAPPDPEDAPPPF